MVKKLRIAVCGGGTGGHVVPALTICKKIIELNPETEVLYIGARNSLEERLAAQAGYEFKPVWISALHRGSMLTNILLPLKMAVSLVQAATYLLSRRSKIVIGTGGFSAWPACAAARITARSYVLWEPNAYPGLVTRLMARGASRIYINFQEVTKKLAAPAERFILTGNPVNSELGKIDKRAARRALGLNPDRETIFVTGGSGGAKSINTIIEKVQLKLIEEGYNLIWQTGKRFDGNVEVIDKLRDNMLINRFFDSKGMSLAYGAADVAITRCGAMTIAELAMIDLPAVVIPFPHSAEGHQVANGKAVEAAGAGIMILDDELTPDNLVTAISTIMRDDKRKKMSRAMKGLAKPDAAERIANDIIKLAV